MNKQKQGAGIEWTQIYGRDGYTWNPIAGCFHDCKWEMPDGTIAGCYAKVIAEKVARSAYPNGFEHHYWNPHRLDEPLKLKTPSGIFLDSMSDLMGHWVTDEQIQQVLDVCKEASQHIFFLLTKNARRLPNFKYPPNVFVGASSPPDYFKGKRLSSSQKDRMMLITFKALSEVNARVRWISFEPLSRDYSWVMDAFYENLPIEWVVVGSASQGKKYIPPALSDFEKMMGVFDEYNVPVFFKGNMRSLPQARDNWRAEFPEVSNE